MFCLNVIKFIIFEMIKYLECQNHQCTIDSSLEALIVSACNAVLFGSGKDILILVANIAYQWLS